MNSESIEKYISKYRCACGIINRFRRKGMDRVTVEQVESMVIALKRINFNVSGDLSPNKCERTVCNFFSELEERKEEYFFQEMDSRLKEDMYFLLLR